MIYFILIVFIIFIILLNKFNKKYEIVISESYEDINNELSFMIIYKNKTKVNPTNINAIVSSLDDNIVKVSVRTGNSYDIRITYRATFLNFSGKAEYYLSRLESIIKNDNKRIIQ